MNFYHRYMADYAKKTARLSLAEHGAYTLLLDEVYSTEQPLPADYQSLYRICRAMDKREQEAVKSVADTYFPLIDGERANPRATREIIKAAPAMQAARFNGLKGGRPKKDPSGVGVNNPVGFSDKTQTEPIAKAPQSSDSFIKANALKNKGASALFVLPDWIEKKHWDAWHSSPKRRNATPSQKQLAVDKLSKWRDVGIDHAKALENAAIGGWQGLFEPKTDVLNAHQKQVSSADRRAATMSALTGNSNGESKNEHRVGIPKEGIFDVTARIVG